MEEISVGFGEDAVFEGWLADRSWLEYIQSDCSRDSRLGGWRDDRFRVEQSGVGFGRGVMFEGSPIDQSLQEVIRAGFGRDGGFEGS